MDEYNVAEGLVPGFKKSVEAMQKARKGYGEAYMGAKTQLSQEPLDISGLPTSEIPKENFSVSTPGQFDVSALDRGSQNIENLPLSAEHYRNQRLMDLDTIASAPNVDPAYAERVSKVAQQLRGQMAEEAKLASAERMPGMTAQANIQQAGGVLPFQKEATAWEQGQRALSETQIVQAKGIEAMKQLKASPIGPPGSVGSAFTHAQVEAMNPQQKQSLIMAMTMGENVKSLPQLLTALASGKNYGLFGSDEESSQSQMNFFKALWLSMQTGRPQSEFLMTRGFLPSGSPRYDVNFGHPMIGQFLPGLGASGVQVQPNLQGLPGMTPKRQLSGSPQLDLMGP